jgi:hypothetical protein
MSSPTTRTYGVLYLIRCDQNGLHKIGITNNWPKRRRQLRVGETTTQVHVVRVNKAEQLERYLHRRFSAKRLPQSEWFTLDSEDLVFVRSVFLKAGSDYKAGGHKSPEVEPPAPPPPRKPEPPTPAQVRNSGVPEGWSDQQARAAAYRHASRAAGQNAQASEPRSSGDAQNRAGGKKSLVTCQVRRYAYAAMAVPFLVTGAVVISFFVDVGRSLKPAAPTEATSHFTLPPLPENLDPVVPPQPQHQLQSQAQTEKSEPVETPQQARERKRAEEEALREAQASQRRAAAEQIRLEWERKEQAKFEKAQAYLRSQCVALGMTSLDLRCAEAGRIVIAYRNKQYQRRKQEAEAYFNDPNSPVPPMRATTPATRSAPPPAPSFTSPSLPPLP